MIIGVLSQKGGVGKTTVAVNLAAAIAASGSRVLVVNAESSGQRVGMVERSRSRAPVPSRRHGEADFAPRSLNLAANDHFIVIDGAPRVNDLARSAILASNLVLIPVQPSPYDIWASSETVRLIREARQINATLEAAFLINRKIARTAIGRDAVAALAQFEDIPVLDVHLSQRILYAESAAKGLAVVEVAPQGEAARELRALGELGLRREGETGGMSKKKIVIKTPSADQADAGGRSPEAGSHAEVLAGAFGASSRRSRGKNRPRIRAEDVVPLPDNPSARSALSNPQLCTALPWDSTIDLAAERTFMQVLALSFFLPSVLGWFWAANAVKRYLQLFAVPHLTPGPLRSPGGRRLGSAHALQYVDSGPSVCGARSMNEEPAVVSRRVRRRAGPGRRLSRFYPSPGAAARHFRLGAQPQRRRSRGGRARSRRRRRNASRRDARRAARGWGHEFAYRGAQRGRGRGGGRIRRARNGVAAADYCHAPEPHSKTTQVASAAEMCHI